MTNFLVVVATPEIRLKKFRATLSLFRILLAFPVIMAMTFLACIIMLHAKYKVNTLYHVIFGLFISVVIFYLNDLSKVLGQTEKISLIQSVWMPVIIIFILGIVGGMQISDK